MELREHHVIYDGKDPTEKGIDDMGGYPLAYERGWDECTSRRLAFARNGVQRSHRKERRPKGDPEVYMGEWGNRFLWKLFSKCLFS